MPVRNHPRATVLLCTRNRAVLLEGALKSLAANIAPFPWELLVVDNTSTDRTAALLTEWATTFPVPLRHVHEPRLGKSIALNTGLRLATGSIFVFGDDDQRFDRRWVEQSCQPLLEDSTLDYTGGPVLPLFEHDPPCWLDLTFAEYRGPLGIFDYGSTRFVFEERSRIPGGGNMAIRASLAARVGGFREDLGRRGRSLLGQEQAEFFSRCRAASACGVYNPEMIVWHHVSAERLRRQYFRRWWYWKGIAHARWQGEARHGIPRFIFGEAARAGVRMAKAYGHGTAATRFLPQLRLAYLAGYAAEARHGSHFRAAAPAISPAVAPQAETEA